ncbi:MAG: Asp-tRNA(Asn)/Glu-tRNA(Gln) amidotransferase subunit GatC [bacterium]
MSVSKKDVEYIANLARLKYSENDLDEMTNDMNKILQYMDKLNELNTDSVEPLSNPLDAVNVFRDDELKPSIDTLAALKNAPDKDDKFFKVPKVISQNK